MAHLMSLNIAGVRRLKAKAERVNGQEWLTIKFGDGFSDTLCVHVNFDLAQLYANAINGANSEYEDMLDEDAAAAHCRKLDHQVDLLRAAE